MRMHRQGERSRTAVPGEDPKHLTELAVIGTTATELDRKACSQYSMLLQVSVVLGNEQILAVVARGTCRKFRAQFMHEIREIARHDRNL
jgi:hypothetical protein